MNWTDGAKCNDIPALSPVTDVILPFNSETEVVCTHASGIGSHSWQNAFYALDLATPYEKSPSVVRAAASGKAFVFLGENGSLCQTPPGSPVKADASTCGMSWGNRVKILHEGGYYSFYVHLERPLVKTGDLVNQGDPIGIEGWTGAAGHRHLHWSFQKLPGDTQQDWEDRISWDGISVPFEFTTYLNGKLKKLNTSVFDCPHAEIGEAQNQPRLKGVH